MPHRTFSLRSVARNLPLCSGEFLMNDLFDPEVQAPARARWADFRLLCQVLLTEISRNVENSLRMLEPNCFRWVLQACQAEPMNRLIGFSASLQFYSRPLPQDHPMYSQASLATQRTDPLTAMKAQYNESRRLTRDARWDTWCQPWSVGKSTIFV